MTTDPTTTTTAYVPKTPDPSCAHHWHPALFQHTVPNHLDQTCCHCGGSRCTTPRQTRRPARGCGKYAPGGQA